MKSGYVAFYEWIGKSSVKYLDSLRWNFLQYSREKNCMYFTKQRIFSLREKTILEETATKKV